MLSVLIKIKIKKNTRHIIPFSLKHLLLVAQKTQFSLSIALKIKSKTIT